MTLPPQGSQHYELRRRIADCRERLRRSRTAQKINGRDALTDRMRGSFETANSDEQSDGRERRFQPLSRR